VLFQYQEIQALSQPPKIRVKMLTRSIGLMAGTYSIKKSSHSKKKFQCVSNHLDSRLDLVDRLDLDANGHQS